MERLNCGVARPRCGVAIKRCSAGVKGHAAWDALTGTTAWPCQAGVCGVGGSRRLRLARGNGETDGEDASDQRLLSCCAREASVSSPRCPRPGLVQRVSEAVHAVGIAAAGDATGTVGRTADRGSLP